jgi:hypothetical protein
MMVRIVKIKPVVASYVFEYYRVEILFREYYETEYNLNRHEYDTEKVVLDGQPYKFEDRDYVHYLDNIEKVVINGTSKASKNMIDTIYLYTGGKKNEN